MVSRVLSAVVAGLHVMAILVHGEDVAPTPKLPPVSPRDALQGKDGAVWVIADDSLFRTDGKQWQELRLSMNPGDRAIVLSRSPDGGVVALWEHRETGHYVITTETADGGSVKAKLLTKQLRNPQILCTSDGGYIVTEQGPRVFRCAPESSEAKLIYTIELEQCVRRGRPAKERDSWNPIYAVEDAKKRIWIHSNVAAGSLDSASLRGVLLIDSGVTRHIPIIPGLADRPLSVLTPYDDQVFWAAVPEDGLYQLYVDEVRAVPVPEPAPQVFSGIERIVSTKDDWWIVSRPLWERKWLSNGLAPAYETPNNQTVLWRLPKGEDKITVILDDLDSEHRGSWAVRRPIVEAKNCTLIAGFGRGIWFVPNSGKPFLMDWRAGFPLLNVERLFLLGPSRYLAVESGRTMHVGVYHPAPEVKPTVGVVEHAFVNLMARDAHGHFWALPADKNSVLAEWTGDKWREHSLPEEIGTNENLWVAIDPKQRVWLLPGSRTGKAGWFDQVREKWIIFPSLRDALQSIADVPASFRFSDTLQYPPQFSGDRRIVYASYWAAVNYFDGERWRDWGGNFLGQEEPGRLSLPYFNADGLLCINRNENTFAFTDEKGWHEIVYEQRPEFEAYPDNGGVDAPPSIGQQFISLEGNATDASPGELEIPSSGQRYDSIVIDETTGDWWLTARGQLYKANMEMYVPVFAPGDNHPFMDGRNLYSAQTDPVGKGGVFLLTSRGATVSTYVQILPRIAPETSITVAQDSQGDLKAQFSAGDDTQVSFQWQIDDGAWSPPSKKTEVVLPPLKLGSHRIRARAIDRFLTTDPTPAETPLEISAPPMTESAALLGQLSRGDPDVRERASKALSKLGNVAVPALREARIIADNATRWWIDATLQEIERLELQQENAIQGELQK